MLIVWQIVLVMTMLAGFGRASPVSAEVSALPGTSAVGLFIVDPKTREFREALRPSLDSILAHLREQGLQFDKNIALIPSAQPPKIAINKYLGYVDVSRIGDSYLISIHVPRQQVWREERNLSVHTPSGVEPHRSVIAAWILGQLWDIDAPCPDMTSVQAKEAAVQLQRVIGAWKSADSWTPASQQAQQEFRAELLRDLDKRIVRCPPLRNRNLKF